MKKLNSAVACLALAGVALAQTNSSSPKLEQRPTPPSAPSPAESETPSVAPDAAVITIEGLCEKAPNSSATPADCKTVVTRAEFEKLINAVQPNLPEGAKKQIAERYATMLYLAEKAHEAGLDQGPGFDEKLYIARLQLLAQLGGTRVHDDAAKVTDGEIANYYQEHAAEFQTISFDRLRIPKQKQAAPPTAKPVAPGTAQKADTEAAAMKAKADQLRARAVAGEDFAKLQQEAYDYAGYTQIKSGDPRVNQARKATVPPADQSIFDLKKGEVSQAFDDGGDYVVYKIEAVEALPVAAARDEITRRLAMERETAVRNTMQKSTKLNDAYFTAPTPAAPPTLRNPGEAAPTVPPAPGKK